jgi:acetyl-CoA synthetase
MSQFDHIIHHPPASFVEQATVAGMDAYHALCKHAEDDYTDFWANTG